LAVDRGRVNRLKLATFHDGGGHIYYTQNRSGLIKDRGLGLVHVYYGQGVGKTTRAVGLAVRAAGVGMQVDFVQFMKSGNSGEILVFANIPNIYYRCPGRHPFILSKGPEEVHYRHASEALSYALEAVERGTQLLICDEILNTLVFNLLSVEDILDLMERCRGRIEFVMTGSDALPEILERADYVTEYIQEKHPYYAGAKARKGIEY
jgi:cob(I)alamin adenosyltransferase